RHWQVEPVSIDRCLQRSKRDDRATLHVVDRGPETFISLTANEELARQCADGVHCVGMCNHENTRPVAATRAPAEQDVAVTIAAREPLDREAEGTDARRDEILHAIDGGGIIGRTFDTNPIEKLGQKCISGEVETIVHAALRALMALAVVQRSLAHEFLCLQCAGEPWRGACLRRLMTGTAARSLSGLGDRLCLTRRTKNRLSPKV